jgi:hypothetical protein
VSTTLVRQSPNHEEDYAGLNELSFLACKELGYMHLQKSLITETTVQKLIRLDAAPFTEESVQKYKRKRSSGTFMGLRITEDLCTFFGVIGLVVLVLPAFVLVPSAVMAYFNIIPWAVTGVAGLIMVAGLLLGGISVLLDNRRSLRWVKIPICDYDKPIPEFALSTALAIKKEFNEGRFFIDELVGDEDPFLVWRYQGWDYYLHVWNEPKFRGQRV